MWIIFSQLTVNEMNISKEDEKLNQNISMEISKSDLEKRNESTSHLPRSFKLFSLNKQLNN